MSRTEVYREELRALPRAGWAAYLHDRSGLPGPRANLELLQAVADVGDAEAFAALAGAEEEYLVCCGVVGLGAVLAAQDAPDIVAALRCHAADPRWRVREAVAMALQRLGDADLVRLTTIVLAWADDPDPRLQRAAVAGVCEPRLLQTSEMAATALDACRRTTAWLAALPASRRREPDVRILRKGLGYCWSVALAADPNAGAPAFRALIASVSGEGDVDRDVAWIVRENLKKKRLTGLL